MAVTDRGRRKCPELLERNGIIYVASSESNSIPIIKVGFTQSHLKPRLRAMNCRYKLRFTYIGFLSGKLKHEQEMHDWLKEYRVEIQYTYFSSRSQKKYIATCGEIYRDSPITRLIIRKYQKTVSPEDFSLIPII